MTAYIDHKATGYIVEISGDKPGWIGLACYYKNNEAKFAFETGYDSHNAAHLETLLGHQCSSGNGMAEANTPSGSKRRFKDLSRAPLLP
jgi:exonuclease III